MKTTVFRVAGGAAAALACVVMGMVISGHEPVHPEATLPWFDSPEGREASQLAEQETVWIAREALYYSKVGIYLSLVGSIALGATLIATYISLDQTRKVLKIQEDHARKQLRAYLDVNTLPLEGFQKGQPARAGIEVINCGQTMAFDVTVKARAMTICKYRTQRWDSSEDLTELTPTYLGPNQKIRARRPTPRITTRIAERMKTSAVGIWWVGEIRYKDIFGEPHEFTFSRCYLRENGSHFTTTPSGNAFYSIPELIALSRPVPPGHVS